MPTQIPFTRHTPIPTYCGCVGIGFYWFLPVPFSRKLPTPPQGAAQEQQLVAGLQRLVPSLDLRCATHRCNSHSRAPATYPPMQSGGSRDHSLIQLFPCPIQLPSPPLSRGHALGKPQVLQSPAGSVFREPHRDSILFSPRASLLSVGLSLCT